MPSASEIYRQDHPKEKRSIVKLLSALGFSRSPESSFHSPSKREIAQEKRAAAKVFGVEEELKGFRGILPGCKVKESSPGTYDMRFDEGHVIVHCPEDGKIFIGGGMAVTREEFQKLLVRDVEIAIREHNASPPPQGY